MINIKFKLVVIKTCCLCIVSCVMLLVSCSNHVYKSKWQNTDFIGDSAAVQEIEPLKYYDPKSKIQYNFTNDNENFYLIVRATEQQTQMKILRAGMQVWIDTTGKKKQQVGVIFPLVQKGQFRKPSSQQGKSATRSDVNSLMKQNIMGLNQMTLSGFKSPMNGFIPVNNQYGIYANIALDSSKIMTYKLAIPFKTFLKRSLYPKDSLKKMTLTLIVNALAAGQGGQGGHQGGGGSGGGHGGGMGGGGMGMGGGMHGGGMRGGGGGGHSQGGDNSTMNEENKILVEFKLATKPATNKPYIN